MILWSWNFRYTCKTVHHSEPTVKHGGGSSMSREGSWSKQKLDVEKYRAVFDEAAQNSRLRQKFTFQQQNDPYRRSGAEMEIYTQPCIRMVLSKSRLSFSWKYVSVLQNGRPLIQFYRAWAISQRWSSSRYWMGGKKIFFTYKADTKHNVKVLQNKVIL